MKRNLIFDETNSSQSMSFNEEVPFIKILHLNIFKDREEVEIDNDVISAKLKFISITSQGEYNLEFKKAKTGYKLNSNFPELKNNHTVSLSFDFSDFKGYELELVYEDIDYKLPSEAYKEFDDHIKNKFNRKIFLSAPFGKGKSTFLNNFFENKKNEYEVFKVFPVNYSIASNKDIFRYIKVDVLLQLISKGVTFDKEEFSNSLLAQQFAINNPVSIIKSLLKIGFSLNKETAPLTKVVDEVEDLFQKFEAFESNIQIDDFEKTKNYIEYLYEEEGSIFEDDFHTQLIRQFVEQLEVENEKETVLIIDDLDRMDPEHIFRILNVISAHYDSYTLEDNKEFNNKFGFDKIILVADINNLKSIYEHRFGKNADFDGYINKFYSNSIFKFDSNKVGQVLLQQLYDKYRDRYNNNDYYRSLKLMSLFNNLEILSLRQIIKLNNNFSFRQLSNDLNKNFEKSRYFRLGLYTPILDYLLDFYHTKENFIKIIDINLRNSRVQLNESIEFICKNLLASITSTFDEKIGSYTLGESKLEFKHVHSAFAEGFMAEEIKVLINDDTKEEFKGFTRDDLCDLLIENIKLL
ncbi:P-loop NTPase fold protein [Psychroflexus aestuariivivens]|uniref:P-loop NTPase fold protein n=1 Tax=Psychroflexus aestuariivivens TaxID=1795040 RepID=UPI000FD9493A|nr:P-loop NTPase fold protein [Psychroflexus aestuariivivens]